jgi:DNA-binding HxlR family transcriptional regulator/peroxiredoxin
MELSGGGVRREDLATASCGIAQALGVVNDWWTLLVIREIVGGETRFTGIQKALGISRRALTERLGELVENGIVERVAYSERPPRHEYQLTGKGKGLIPVLLALQDFGDRYVAGNGAITAQAEDTSGEATRIRDLVGSVIPGLTLPDAGGAATRLRPDGHWRVVYFFVAGFVPDDPTYPLGWDDVPGAVGCLVETSAYADRFAEFAACGADVVGVSAQEPAKLAAFGGQLDLPFPLLSDQNLMVAAALRLPIFTMGGATRYKRQSLLLDPGGTVRHVQIPITDPADSAREMLDVLRASRR